jgi:3-oxoacyl-[acyl-carrier protein] reductase
MTLSTDLTGRVALVTGSTRGLGLLIAQHLADAGAVVGINGRSGQAVSHVAGSREEFFAAPGDLTDENQVLRVRDVVQDRHGALDVLVCNAGGGRPVDPAIEAREWRRVMDLNLITAVNAVQALAPLMARSGGSICVVGSIAGTRDVGAPLPYAVAKAALHGYVRASARSLAADGIRINLLIPGNILFAGSVWEARLLEDEDAVMSQIRASVPLQRLASGDEIAGWALFLSSDAAAFATGAEIIVDGGQVL